MHSPVPRTSHTHLEAQIAHLVAQKLPILRRLKHSFNFNPKNLIDKPLPIFLLQLRVHTYPLGLPQFRFNCWSITYDTLHIERKNVRFTRKLGIFSFPVE